ncbi:MAG: fructose-specific PTS transporter subunit EIIC [Lactobacillus sp.]|nr:fructose-specific PTS transporter subunit EIIC [Lactobacillus sp.]
MKIKDILAPESMIMDLKATTKDAAIEEMADLEVATGIVNDKDAFVKSIWDREKESTTGIGGGIAMPHARNKSINKARVLFAKSKAGVDFDALDGQPVNLFFMITAPDGADNTHLQALSKLASLLINPDLVEKLKAATTPEEVISLFEAAEQDKDEADKKSVKPTGDKPLIVGVTACINGIAHTYMAEEALIKAGEKLGVDVRIETNGSEGVKHQLTADEIKRSIGVVIASDKKVDMPRFDGKRLTNHAVVDGINKPEELIQTILDKKANVYHATEGEGSEEVASTGIWGNIYKNLMSGVSHMLPFVIGGGILMAISFLIENYGGGANTPAFKALNNMGTLAFGFMVPVLSAYIAESIGDLPALMPGFVGGMMAANSGAGFLGGLASGFIAGYLMILLKKLCSKFPKNLEGMKPMLVYPILGLLFIALIMAYVIDPIFSGINHAITGFLNGMSGSNLALLTLILAGMMAIDMGGPFNKAAYVFASGAFANDPKSATAAVLMAAVMVGGMVPPFAIAIATSIFKNKFTKDERNAGISNWVLGFSFITEGAIPFAASDPGRVIPSCIIGSAIAGAIVGFFKVGVPAPHGGFWVSPLSNNIVMFFVATIIGSLVAAFILGLWKKEIKK